MRLKKLGQFLLALGFLGAAFFTVSEETTIDWWLYAVAMFVGLIGLVSVHVGTRMAKRADSKLAANVHVVADGLGRICEILGELQAAQEETNVYEVRHQIDERLREDLWRVADARESVSARFGLQKYADMMTQFAGGERYINRAWSASADGYIDEVWSSVERAASLMDKARTLMQAYLAEK